MGRINAWHTATNIALDRITGAGFATATQYIFSIYSPDNTAPVLVAHSIYFQVLGEHGFIGLALYLAFWWVTYFNAAKAARLAAGMDDLIWARDLARMIQVGLLGFFVGGAFLSLAYWDGPFYLMVLVVALNGIVAREKASREVAAIAARNATRVSPTHALNPK
jgi:probable O-glycosylation ligase (exosortase A-associated)